MMVVVNDVMAYMWGFAIGRTPLIQLSPKKTWEGFIGGGVSFLKYFLQFFGHRRPVDSLYDCNGVDSATES